MSEAFANLSATSSMAAPITIDERLSALLLSTSFAIDQKVCDKSHVEPFLSCDERRVGLRWCLELSG
jgi:hypothetical protein